MPHIALHGDESLYTGPFALRDGWIAYPDGRPDNVSGRPDVWLDDVSGQGVLVLRTVGTATGPVRAADISPHRQFACMSGLLCQGCGRPSTTDPESDAWLWVLPVTQGGRPVIPSGLLTESPPVCADCVHDHIPRCPVLKHGRQLLWVSEAPVVGVMATVNPPPALSSRGLGPRFLPLPADDADESARAAWDCAVAHSLVRQILAYRVADPDEVAELRSGPDALDRVCPFSGPGHAVTTAGEAR
ncbi:hypothetical protein [Streptomyces sp. NPDC001787]|uniref:hypothetical protein n=1 Tax=Streptomyces sp. NPDC001787 TaxID=3154523 RepID=UPI003330F664